MPESYKSSIYQIIFQKILTKSIFFDIDFVNIFNNLNNLKDFLLNLYIYISSSEIYIASNIMDNFKKELIENEIVLT